VRCAIAVARTRPAAEAAAPFLLPQRKGVLDSGKNAVHIPQHLVVPEADYAIAFAFDKARAAGIIVRRLTMLSAIDFDHQPLRKA
jgi:hypothetical protein